MIESAESLPAAHVQDAKLAVAAADNELQARRRADGEPATAVE
jgi:fructose-specific phosphotransferase system component IIB